TAVEGGDDAQVPDVVAREVLEHETVLSRRIQQAPGRTADQPPSTTRLAPVTYEASSEARKRAHRATSSGAPIRPSGMARAMARIGWPGASRSPSVAGGRIMPGLMQLARMPCRAPSAASCFVIATTPPLDAVCAIRVLVSDPVMPAVEPTSSTLPPPRAMRCGQACLVTRKTMSSSLRRVNDQSA